MNNCPSADQVQSFLDEQLGDTERAALAGHVDTCLDCQHMFEQLTSSQEIQTWRKMLDTRESLRKTGSNGEAALKEVFTSRTDPFIHGQRRGPWPTVPGYEVLAELGRGGMGVVYQARDVRLDRIVALKMLLAGGHAGPAERARLRSEAEAIAQLQHPNIVHVYEVGEVEDRPYLTLEFVAGGNLARELAGTPQRAARAAGLIETLARAVAFAHRHGIVHRDLKPANILLTADGTPKIADFGLAKRMAQAGVTQTDAVLGTASYLSPEQAMGNKQAIGPAADIYALGAILYEMLTGRAPFKAETALETLLLVRDTEPAPPRILQPKVPRDIETICLKCLEKTPNRRYSTAEALADDLHRFLTGVPIKVRQTGSFERTWKLVRRYPARFAVTCLLGMAAVGIPFAIILAVQQNHWTATAEQQMQKERYFRNIVLADREWQEARAQSAMESLEDCPPGLRAWEWNHLKRRGQACLLKLDGPAGALAWSHDGSSLMTGDRDGTLRLWDVEGGRELQRFQGHTLPVHCGAFSPDGRQFYSGSQDRTVKVWDVFNGKEVRSFAHETPVISLALANNGEILTTGGDDAVVTVWATKTGRTVLVIDRRKPSEKPNRAFVAVTSNGSHVAYTGLDDGQAVVTVVHLIDNESVPSWGMPGRKFQGIAFSPDGASLAVASGSEDNRRAVPSEVVVYDWRTRQMQRKLPVSYAGINNLYFSQDGLRLAARSGQGGSRVWETKDWEHLMDVRAPGGVANAVVLSPDGQKLAAGCTDGAVYVWDATTEQAVSTYRGHRGIVNSVVFSPNSDVVATGGADYWVMAWKRSTGKTLFEQKHPGTWKGVASVTFDHTGTRLASASKGKTVAVWSVPAREQIVSLDNAKVVSVAFSPDGSTIATGGDDKTIRIWNADSGQQLRQLKGHEDIVTSVTVSPDGSRLVSCSRDTTAQLWDLAGKRENLVFRQGSSEITAAVFSPDGVYLALGDTTGTIKVWDTRAAIEVATLRGHLQKVAALAWSPDGRRLASASDDKSIKLWEPLTGVEVLTLTAHKGAVATIAWDRSGNYLASGSWDGTAKVWDGRPLDR